MDTSQRPKPILIDRESMEAIKRIQARERQKSPLGVAPSIQDLARGLLRKAINDSAGS